MSRTPLLVVLAAALSVGAYWLSQQDETITASLTISETMSSDTSGGALEIRCSASPTTTARTRTTRPRGGV